VTRSRAAGADVIAVAHHVEHSAHASDEAAITVLMEAADAARASAPAGAARFCAAVLRLLPAGAGDRERRAQMQAALADAQSAAGDPAAARATLLDALRVAEGAERLGLTVAATYADLWLGRPKDARRRLQVALRDLPAEPSRDRLRLRLSLGMTALFECDLREAEAQASDALDDARRIGDRVLAGVVPVLGTLARVADARAPHPGGSVEDAASELERLSGEQLATRLPALWMLGRARRMTGDFVGAFADLQRGRVPAAETERETVRLLFVVESVGALIELGRLQDAAEIAEEGVELARLAGSPPLLLWAQSALAGARLAAGDIVFATREAQEAQEAQRSGTQPDFCATGQPGWGFGLALAASGEPAQGARVMLDALGGPGLTLVLAAERPAAAADLVEVLLACDRSADAEQALARGEQHQSVCSSAVSSPSTFREGDIGDGSDSTDPNQHDTRRARARASGGSRSWCCARDAGRLGDLIGRRRIFLAGLAVFTSASVACGLADTRALLIAARFVQGVGGAMTSAVILGMIVTMFPKSSEQAKAIGVYSFVAAAGGSIGLLAGGVLTEAINWHWIFFVNAPIGIATGLLAIRLLSDDACHQQYISGNG
jgi:tetratricopeptide (TPR) repeat protein